MMQHLLIALVGLVFFSCASAKTGGQQERVLTKVENNSAASTRDSLLLDALGQVYSWRADGTLEKLRSANQLAGIDTLRYRYHNVRLGRLASVDLTNPLRPVLFYPDAQTVVMLHRNLVELRQIKLLDLGLDAVDAVAYAPNEGLWVYAPDRQQLLQLDRNGAIRQRSPELSQVFNSAIRAACLVATPQQVVLVTDTGRMLLFGPFGSYRSELLRRPSSVQANEKTLLFFEDGQWWRYGGDSQLVEPVAMPNKDQQLVSMRGEFVLWRNGPRWWVETR